MPDLPVACTLSPEALATRRQGLLAELLGRADVHEVLADGHRWSFEATNDVWGKILRMVEAEHRCCKFLRFDIIVEPDGGPISVELTGPPGTREFLAALVE
jgi:hypothetical protein